MPGKEWSLIVNSLMIQLAVGMLAFAAIFRLASASVGGAHAAVVLTAPGMLLIGAAIATGMLVSLFHLGKPFRAPRALVNFKTSWLSREVLFTALLLGLWGVCFLLQKQGTPSDLMTWTTVSVGLLCVFSMAGIYRAIGVKGWHGGHAHVGFFGSVMVLGSVGATLIIIHTGQAWVNITGWIVTALILSLLMLAIRCTVQFRLIFTLKSTSDEWDMNRRVCADRSWSTQHSVPFFKKLIVWAWALSSAAVGFVLYMLLAEKTAVVTLSIAAGVLLLLGELLGRTGFYSLRPEEVENTLPGIDRDAYGRYLGTAAQKKKKG